MHKKQWSVCILGEHLEFKMFSQPPEPRALHLYLCTHFPGHRYLSAYESGFSGFWAHRELESLGIDNLVVNPGDVPTTDKEKRQKRDSVDCRKIARSLRAGELNGIHVPDPLIDQDKVLVRSRVKLLRDVKRCKNRIKSQLLYWGVRIPGEMESPYWSKRFRAWLRERFPGTDSAGLCILSQLDALEGIEEQKKRLERYIVQLSETRYAEVCGRLRGIPGIGLLGAMTMATEIGDIHRFTCLDRLHSFVGLVPRVSASGERESVGGITQRHNHYLRTAIIQCAWRAAKQDPVLFRDYNRLCKRMKPSKAIIRIAKKLLNRAAHVWKNRCTYRPMGA